MKRRTFIKSLGGCGAAVFTGSALAKVADPKPNILWLSCEDIGPHLGCYGQSGARTPVLDRLAADGIRYTRAFSVTGVCAPTRSSIITGVYPTTLGTMHMRAGGEGVDRSIKPVLAQRIRPFPACLREAGYYCSNNVKQDYNFDTPAGTWDESSDRAHWRNRPAPDQPFFAVFNFTGTHEGSLQTPAETEDPEVLDTLPPYYPDTELTRRTWTRYHQRIAELDGWIGGLLAQLDEDGESGRTVVFFWSDHGPGLPRAKRWPYDSGTHVPLIVRVPQSYQRKYNVSAGTVDGGLVSSIDFGATVLHLAGLELPGFMQGRPFLGPGELAGREFVVTTRDRMDERYDIIRSVRDRRYRYIRNYEPFRPYDQVIQTAEKSPVMREIRRLDAAGGLSAAVARLVAPSKPAEELYDLEADPHELHNLAEQSELRPVLERLSAVLDRWMAGTRDLGLIPEPQLEALESEAGSRFEILSRPGGAVLLEDLVRLAATAIRSAPENRSVLLEALLDRRAPMRYWAARGLGWLAAGDEETHEALAMALNDRDPCVRTAAALSLCLLDSVDTGLPVLIEELASPHQWVRLHAAIALDGIGEAARPALKALQQALGDRDNKYVVRVANHALNRLLGTDNEVR